MITKFRDIWFTRLSSFLIQTSFIADGPMGKFSRHGHNKLWEYKNSPSSFSVFLCLDTFSKKITLILTRTLQEKKYLLFLHDTELIRCIGKKIGKQR